MISSCVRPLEPGHVADDVLQQVDAEVVVAVEREVVADQDAAARAERQAFDVIVLRAIGRHAIDRADRRRSSDRRPPGCRPCATPSGTARAATATPSARRRCCRTRSPRRRPEAAPWRRCRARADRESRWRIRRGSGDAAASGRGWAGRARRGRARSRAARRTRRCWPGRAAACRAAASSRRAACATTFSQVSARPARCRA